jgi:hypothetical protein
MSEKQLDFLDIFPAAGNNTTDSRQQKIQAAEMENRRLSLLTTDKILKLDDFAEFMPEIEAYALRLASFKQAYQQANPGRDKENLYWKMIDPHIHDEANYRDSARLYLRYLASAQASESAAASYGRSSSSSFSSKNKKEKTTYRPSRPQNINLKSGKNAAAKMYD